MSWAVEVEESQRIGSSTGGILPDTTYWWRCFMAAAQRMMKNPIHSAAR